MTAIDTDGRGVYATASVLVGNDIEEREEERVLIEAKSVQEETEDDEKLQQIKFDISGMADGIGQDPAEFTYKLDDGSKIGKNNKHGFKTGIPNHVIVTGKSRGGKKEMARLSVMVPGDNPKKEKDDQKAPKPTETTRKKVGKKKEIQVTSVKTLGDFVDNLTKTDFAMGRRLYLEWRPSVKNVVIDLSNSKQSKLWKCRWTDIAERKCEDILKMTEQFRKAADNRIGTLWSANQVGSGPTERKTDEDQYQDIVEFLSEQTLEKFTQNQTIRGTLYMKRRHIPKEIVIDLSKLSETGKERLQWIDIKNKTQKGVLELLQQNASYTKYTNSRMEEYFQIFSKEKEFKKDTTVKAFILELIHEGLCPLKDDLILELRHTLESIKISVSYGSWDDAVLSYGWWELADKNYDDILETIRSELKGKKHDDDVPQRDRAQLWFKPTLNRSNFDAPDIDPIQFDRRGMLDFVCHDIGDKLEQQDLSLKALNGTLSLEWKCPPTEIIVRAVYDGKLKEYPFPWNKNCGKTFAKLTMALRKDITSMSDQLWFVASAQCLENAPYAVISATRQDGIVTFNASDSRDRNGNPCSLCVWNFGDGERTQITHKEGDKLTFDDYSFNGIGIYTVKCTVIDSEGNMAMCSIQQLIGNRKQTDRDDSFSVWSSVFEAAPNQMVNFYASDLGLKALSYRWYFGDGTDPVTSKCPRETHIFDKAGSYPVRVEVSEPEGKGQREFKRSATLQQRVCRANRDGPAAVIVAEPKEKQKYPQKEDSDGNELVVKFDASGSRDKKGQKCEHFWFDFGDGSRSVKSIDGKEEYSYDVAGTYLVTVVAEDEERNRSTASLIHRIVAKDQSNGNSGKLSSLTKGFGGNKNKSDIISDGTFQCLITPQIQCARPLSTVGQLVSFWVPDRDEEKVQYQWDFGDESDPGEESNVEHIYKKPGSYSITVSIVDNKRKGPKRAVCTHCVLPLSKQYQHIAYMKSRVLKKRSDGYEDRSEEVNGNEEIVAEPDVQTVKGEVLKFISECKSNRKRELEALKSKIEALEKTLMVKESGTDAGIEKEEKKPKDPLFIFDFGDKSPPNILSKRSVKAEVDHTFQESGTYQVTVTAIDADGHGVYATASVQVGGGIEEKEEERVLDIEAKSVQEETEDEEKGAEEKDQNKTKRKKAASRRQKAVEFTIPSVKTLQDLFDELKERNVAMGRRLYLEWRPLIKIVTIDLPLNGQQVNWKCSWSEFAEWECQDILQMTEQRFGMVGGANNGTATLWVDDPALNESNIFNKEFASDAKMRDLCPSQKSAGKQSKNLSLNLKMRYIPSEIVIDLSSLKKGEKYPLKWYDRDKNSNGFNKHLQCESLIKSLREFKSVDIVIPKDLDQSFKFYLKQNQPESDDEPDEEDTDDESQLQEENEMKQLHPNDDTKDDEKQEDTNGIQFEGDITVEQFALSLIDGGIPLGKELCLELRHALEDIQINISYDDGKTKKELYRKWSQIGSKNCGEILDEIKESESSIKYGKESALLCFHDTHFNAESNSVEDDSDSSSEGSYDSDSSDDDDVHSRYIQNVKCASDKTLAQCIDDFVKEHNKSLSDLGKPLRLEWRQMISKIKVIMSHNGKMEKWEWKDAVKQWDPKTLRNKTIEKLFEGKMAAHPQLNHMAPVFRMKTRSGTKEKKQWEEWEDGTKLEAFVSKLQNKGVRLEGELILLLNHLPNEVMIHLPYFGADLSFSFPILESGKGNKKLKWAALRNMTINCFMDQIKGHEKYGKLDLPDNFESQLWWIPSEAAPRERSAQSDDGKIGVIQEYNVLEEEESNEKEDPMNGVCCLNYEDYMKKLESIWWFKVRVEGQESREEHPFSLRGTETRSAIIKKVASDLKDQSAYKRLYFGGDSQEEQITLSKDQKLYDFATDVRKVSGKDAGVDKERAIELVFVEIKELLFDGSHDGKQDGRADNEKVSEWKLSDLMKMLEAKGVYFEKPVLHLEWRPSVTSIHVDVSYDGREDTVNFEWPKWQQTDCPSIMKRIRKCEGYRKLKIPDKGFGIPMLWFVAAGKVKKQNAIPDTGPHPTPESKSELEEKYEHEIENGGRSGIDRFKQREASHLSAAEDVNEFENEKLLATKDSVGPIRFEDKWPLHELITEAYKTITIQDHIHLEWRFVPKTVLIRVPFAKRLLLPNETLLITEPDNHSHENRSWDKVRDSTCDTIKNDKIGNDDDFKEMMKLLPDSKWDLWYIKKQLTNELIRNAENQPADPQQLEEERTVCPVAKKRTIKRDKSELNGEPIMFDPKGTLEEFVLMLRRKKHVEPGDELVLEYRRVPSEIVVDLSYFDVGKSHPITKMMDESLETIMREIENELLEKYGVREDDGGQPHLDLDKECILKQEDVYKVREWMKRKKKKKRLKDPNEEDLKFNDGNQTLRQFVESLRAKGIELQSKMTFKWDHDIDKKHWLNIQLELLPQGICSKEIEVHRFVSYNYLIQKLKDDPIYRGPEETNTLSSLYFNSLAISSKASKMVIFQRQKNLKAFLDELEERMVDTKELIENEKIFKLQYLEGMLYMN